jgi:hypothetical protein
MEGRDIEQRCCIHSLPSQPYSLLLLLLPTPQFGEWGSIKQRPSNCFTPLFSILSICHSTVRSTIIIYTLISRQRGNWAFRKRMLTVNSSSQKKGNVLRFFDAQLAVRRRLCQRPICSNVSWWRKKRRMKSVAFWTRFAESVNKPTVWFVLPLCLCVWV